MTIRRSERDWSDDDEFMDEEDLIQRVWDSVHDSAIGNGLNYSAAVSDLKHKYNGPALHPAITDFGPPSLPQFLRAEIDKAKAEGRLGKAKGKESVPPRPRYSKDGVEKRTNLTVSTYTQPAWSSPGKSGNKPVQNPRLQLAPNALLHLKGLTSKEEVPEVNKPGDLRQPALSSAGPLSGFVESSPETAPKVGESRRRNRTIPRRTCTLTRRTDQESSGRGLDFAQHTQEVRIRTRSEHDQRPPRQAAIHSDGGLNELPRLDFSSFTQPHPSNRRRRTPESLSHLISSSDSEGDDDHHMRSDPRLLGTGRSNSSRLGRTTSDALSDFLPSDDEVNFNTLDGLFQSLTTDESSPGGFSEGDEEPDVYTRDFTSFSPGALSGRRISGGWRTQLRNDAEVPNHLEGSPKATVIKEFNYTDIVPSEKPRIVAHRRTELDEKAPAPRAPIRSSASASRQARRRPLAMGTNADVFSETNTTGARRGKRSSKIQVKFSIANDILSRRWNARFPTVSALAPPICEVDPNAPPRNIVTTLQSTVLPFNYDVWSDVVEYLSFEDLQNLRLTCTGLATEIAPLMLRSVVTNFGKSMFNPNQGNWNSKKDVSLANSMLAKYGHEIHRFGISFDYDAMGLAYATPKVTEKRENAWYGSYRWPLETYPRFTELQELEDLVDNNRPLLKDSLGLLKGVSELALSLDSGHGWLNGPDISDLALFELRRKKGTRIFGQSFGVEDTWHAFGRGELFKWAQQNSINETLKVLSTRPDNATTRRKISEFQNMMILDYDSFYPERSQPDFDPFSHTGGQALHPPPQQPPQQPQLLQIQPGMAPVLQGAPPQPILTIQPAQPAQHANPPQLLPGNLRRLRQVNNRQRNEDGDEEERKKKSKGARKIPLQWPIIFNGYNLAADCGGRNNYIQNKVANPSQFPLIPGHLSEAQVQWLMETVWAQRAFLSAYTTAVITHKRALSKVHTLTIAKISSGLLPSLAQKEFWASLTGLKRLKILVSPDWRHEHVPGDKFFATHMAIPPVTATSKFAEFLQKYVARLENLSHLTVGYIGGGENATGMFARNQHLLPAPITTEPRIWITDHAQKPNPSTLFKFDHIRDLTFENCWFSPCMLEEFMEKSRDTSLHTLVLDSVSLLSKHSTGIDGHLQTVRNGLRCRFDENAWLHEDVPSSATWTEVLDKMTPGVTMLERKYAAGMIDADLEPMPMKEFRGNVQKIVLKSCGYAKISGVKGDEFNQNALVMQSSKAIDIGLHTRKQLFDKFNGAANAISDDDDRNNNQGQQSPRQGAGTTLLPVGTHSLDQLAEAKSRATKDMPVMMSVCDPATGSEWFGLGTLTQCVHPVEKRILGQAWGMRFGWGNSIERWASVEDGCFEGGTGRFSGVIEREVGGSGGVGA